MVIYFHKSCIFIKLCLEMADCEKTFVTPKEEADYWHEEAKKYKKQYENTLEELNDCHGAKIELEVQLNQSELKIKEYEANNSRLFIELTDVKEKYQKLQRSSYLQTSDLEMKLEALENYKETTRKYIRELEQTNDDLERADRAALATIDDLDFKLNHAIENGVFLETEMEEKEAIFFSDVQHLMEEVRELKQELTILNKKENEDKNPEQEIMRSVKNDAKKPSTRRMNQSIKSIKNLNESCINCISRATRTAFKREGEATRAAALALVTEMINRIWFMEKKSAVILTGKQIQHSPTLNVTNVLGK